MVDILKVIGGIAIAVITSIVVAYANHIFGPPLGIGDPDLQLVNFEPSQASFPHGNPNRPNSGFCGGIGQLGCSYGTVYLKIANDGKGKATQCYLQLTESYKITGGRGGSAVTGSMERSVNLSSGISTFDILQQTTKEMTIDVAYPYLGDYKFYGSLTCQEKTLILQTKELTINS